MQETRSALREEFATLPSLERESLLSDLRASTNERLERTPLEIFRRSYSKTKQIQQLLRYSNYPNLEVADKGFIFYSQTFMAIYALYVFGKRRRWTGYIGRLLPLIAYHGAFHGYLAERKGLYKTALFENDQLSQEVRLLLMYHFPDNEFATPIQQKIEAYRYQHDARTSI